jgi:hypothetical protein
MSSESDRLFDEQVKKSGAVQIGSDSPQTLEEAEVWRKSDIPVVAIVGSAVTLILLALAATK